MPAWFATIVGLRSYLSILKRDFGTALKEWEGESNDPADNRARVMARTVIHVLAGDAADPSKSKKPVTFLESKVQAQPE